MSPDNVLYSLGKCEPKHDKRNKMTCVPSKDSDKPGHIVSMIRVLAVHLKKVWVLNYSKSAQGRLIRLGRCPGCGQMPRVI